jgi:hypothetical protein
MPWDHHLQTSYGIVNALQVVMEGIPTLSKSWGKSAVNMLYA